MEKIDAHCHFWVFASGNYDWLDAAGPELDSLRHDFLPAELSALNGGVGVIAVQAAPREVETRYLLDLAVHHPQIRGVVGWVDLSDPTAAGRLTRLASDRNLCGLRPMLQDLPQDDWIATAPHPDVLAAMVRLGLRFDALVKPRHLAALARFADRNVGLRIIIDHAAKPCPGGGLEDEWASGMASLARNKHIYCKLSGLLTELEPSQRRSQDTALAVLRPLVRRLIDWFGPERLVWGSDWPVLTLAATYTEWEAMTEALLDDLSDADRRAILGGNAARFYGLGEAQA